MIAGGSYYHNIMKKIKQSSWEVIYTLKITAIDPNLL